MRLDSVKLALPSRVLTNDQVVALVRDHSQTTFQGNIDRVLKEVRTLLHRSGARYRHWRAPGEEVLTLLAQAVNQAIDAAQCSTSDIDLLIYSGVDRGFIEPATAYLVAQALNLRRVSCFDVIDACNGWTRSLQLLYALFRSGMYRRALIINSEFSMFEGGPVYPQLFTLQDQHELAWSFAGYTLGEGVTATILSADPERDWEFHISSRPDLADLSTVPLLGYERYCQPSNRIGRREGNFFVAFSGEMFGEATKELGGLFRCLQAPVSDVRMIFPNGATKRNWDEGAAMLGVAHLMYSVYPRYGNLVSASIPAGLASAIDSGQLHRGERVAICGASAGMSFSVCSFVY
jgi:acyl-CoA:acyl-CoA alkyltransferase